ncbi:hypothetical protein N0V90_010187 [Kalmusia sp. IMI 367209]|nr:hypothetical protein N0V90_010187 [Kalmusia sp. IMI 367209]
MPFTSLPPELTIAVAEFLDPFSSLNYALTCKGHWKLCNPIIKKHERLFAENRTINANDPVWPHQNHLLWDKLKQILDDPNIGHYVREISLPSQRATYLDPNAAHEFQLTAQSPHPPQEDIDRYAVVTQEIEELYGPQLSSELGERGALDDWIFKGASEPIIAMLVHKLPYLKIFRFTDLEMGVVFMRIMQLVAISYNDPALAPRLPFQHLTTVAVAHWDTEMPCDPEWCQFFCSVPSVRSFIAYAMGGNIETSVAERLPKSNVKELVFSYSRFSTESLEEIVRNTPALERFSYDVAGATVSEDVTPMSREVLKMLREHVGHSLQHMVFEHFDIRDGDYDGEDLPEVSLRDFQQLKTLRIDWRILWPNDWDEIDEDHDEELADGGFYTEDETSKREFDVRSLLPASLEALYLEGAFTHEEMEEVSKIRDGPSEFTPLLKKIWIQDTYQTRQDNEELPGVWANPLHRYLEGQG